MQQRVSDFSEFERLLSSGSRLVRTEKFNRHTPTERSEVLVSDWLESADNLDALVRVAEGRLSGDRIARVVFEFYNRALVDLGAAPGDRAA